MTEARPWVELVMEELEKPIDESRVRFREVGGGRQAPYLEGYDVINTANRIFGHLAWSMETLSLTPGVTNQGRAFYTALVRVIVAQESRVGVGVGIVERQRGSEVDTPEAHETAIKGAETDAMKRAFRTFGEQLGNGLYDKQSPQRGGNSGGRPGPRAAAPAANRTRAAASGAARPERPAAAAAAVAGDGPDPRLGRFPNVGAFLSEVTSELNMKRADVFKIANLLDRAPPAALLDYDGGLDELYQACVQAPLAEVAE